MSSTHHHSAASQPWPRWRLQDVCYTSPLHYEGCAFFMVNEQPKVIFVSGGNDRYYPLIAELVQSLERLKTAAPIPFDIGLMNGGLTEAQQATFAEKNVQIVTPQWPSEKARQRAQGRDYLLMSLCRPDLDQLFPEHDLIVWLDADSWVQQWAGLEAFIHVAQRNKLAVVSQASRLQDQHIHLRRRWGFCVEPRGILFKNARRAGLPRKLAWSLVSRPVLNAGAFALSRSAPHWVRWRHWRDQCIHRGRLFTSDQLALALAVYHDGLPHECLPDTCNYMGPWRFDQTQGLFVDYFYPYDPVTLIHAAGHDANRLDLNYFIPATDQDDQPIEVSLRYAQWIQEKSSRKP